MASELNNTPEPGKAWWKTALFWAVTLLVCVPVHGHLLLANSKDLADDAMISARYARNLAYGDGLRYNREPTDARPVEGYSNFLWVVGVAAGLKLQQHPRIITALFGGICSLVSIVVLGWWVRKRTGSGVMGFLAALVLASSNIYAVWAVQGLETALFAALALSAVAVCDPERPGPFEYMLAFLACITRPDGLIVAAAILASQLLVPGRDMRRIAGRALIFFGLPFGIYTVWRVLYFGSLIPNVFHAKTGLGLPGIVVGGHYLFGWVINQWPIAIFLCPGLACIFRFGKLLEQCRYLLAPIILVVLYLGFVVSVGGDFMPGHRFIMHVLPVILGMGVIAILVPGKSLHRQGIVMVMMAIALAWNVYRFDNYHNKKESSFNRDWHQNQADWYGLAASWLARHADRADVIACGDIGYIGYMTDAPRILDTNGLVDTYLAKRPGAASLDTDPDYVLDLNPDFLVVMVHYFEGGQMIGHSAFDRAVLSGALLEKEYRLVVEVPGWKSTGRSFDDGRQRTSHVRFRIYERAKI